MSIFSFLPKGDAEVLCKLAFGEEAEGPQPEPTPVPQKPSTWEKVSPYAQAVAGTALGTLSGAGALHIADTIHRENRGGAPLPGPWRTVLPLAGAAAGLLYNVASQKQQEELNRVREAEQRAAAPRR